jgi:hypothetical protein
MGMIPEVVDITDPKRITRGILKSLEYMLGEAFDNRNISRFVGDESISSGNSNSLAATKGRSERP